ncbi:MAG: multidrug effflux MFS transporter [Sphingomonas fennica]
MTHSPERSRAAPDPGIGFHEFVALIAGLMAVNAFGIDSMLVALPAIGESLGVTNGNDRQWIITTYMLGFGVAQLVYGPLADRYGRKPILVGSMGLFAVLSVAAGLAGSFPVMLAARFLQGVAAAASRVLSVSIVRDCYSGRQMARVMSLSFIVFLAVPILAPSLGQIIMLVAPWRAIFFVLGLFGAAIAIWASLRLNETLHPEYAREISLAELKRAAGLILGNRTSLFYTFGGMLLFGSLLGYISSIEQIFSEVFDRLEVMTIVFAAAASVMGVAAFLNSRIVEQLGVRRVSHTALIGFIVTAAAHVALSASGREELWSFAVLQAIQFGCFALIGSNFNSMAMEPVGAVAGTASSVQGFISTVGGALIGMMIGQAFDGTTLPVMQGFLIVGIATLGMVLIAERGRLFRGHHGPAEATA